MERKNWRQLRKTYCISETEHQVIDQEPVDGRSKTKEIYCLCLCSVYAYLCEICIQYSSTALQTASSKMTILLNQLLSKTVSTEHYNLHKGKIY